MHAEAMKQMDLLLNQVAAPPGGRLAVLDVGSLDINGTYRLAVERHGWHYTGLDVRPGENVDIFAPDPYHYPIAANKYDLVISGSTMEHVQAIWLWVPELVRVLKPGGSLIIITHWRFPEHKFPVDCWRIMPDGMRFLFDTAGQLADYVIEMYNQHDIYATARKVKR